MHSYVRSRVSVCEWWGEDVCMYVRVRVCRYTRIHPRMYAYAFANVEAWIRSGVIQCH